MTTRTGPARHGADGTSGASPGAVNELTVLHDAGCRMCQAAQRWLASRDALVPLRFLPAGSAQTRQRFPDLDHRTTLRNLTMAADTDAVWKGDRVADLPVGADGTPRALPPARHAAATAAGGHGRVRRSPDTYPPVR